MEKEKLEKIILKYSGMAGAVLSTGGVHAQIVHIDVPDTTLDRNGSYFDVDFIQDTSGLVDFRIYQIKDSSSYDINGIIIQNRGNAGNQVMGIEVANYNYAYQLYLNDTIDASKEFSGINEGKNVGYLAFEVLGDTYTYSEWVNPNGIEGSFLGVKFRSPVNDTLRTFYGWIRLDVAADLKSCIIRDFAYNSQYDSAITAGQLYIGEQEFEMEKPELVQRGSVLEFNLPDSYRPEGKLIFTALSGAEIRSIDIHARKNSIELTDLPKGVILATVYSNGLKNTRKIVIY